MGDRMNLFVTYPPPSSPNHHHHPLVIIPRLPEHLFTLWNYSRAVLVSWYCVILLLSCGISDWTPALMVAAADSVCQTVSNDCSPQHCCTTTTMTTTSSKYQTNSSDLQSSLWDTCIANAFDCAYPIQRVSSNLPLRQRSSHVDAVEPFPRWAPTNDTSFLNMWDRENIRKGSSDTRSNGEPKGILRYISKQEVLQKDGALSSWGINRWEESDPSIRGNPVMSLHTSIVTRSFSQPKQRHSSASRTTKSSRQRSRALRTLVKGHTISTRSERRSPTGLRRVAPKHYSLLDSTQTFRMDHGRVVMMDYKEPSSPGTNPQTVQSMSHRDQHSSGGGGGSQNSDTARADQNNYPILTFQYVEPSTIELLIVVTKKMRDFFGDVLLKKYLDFTMNTVSSMLRHPTLKTSIKLNIVDIVLMDQVYAHRHSLEDWSYSKQEQVMAKFCAWVNRLRRPNFNWDSAILLNIGHFKSTALGVAHYRSMCSAESACLAVLDRGFGTGYIIAHELGHQLGAKHDFELNSDCGREEQSMLPRSGKPTNDVLGTAHVTAVDDIAYPNHYWYPQEANHEAIIRRDTIMSGTLYFNNFPLRWSACSRQAIHDFIGSSGANCLRQETMPSPLLGGDWFARRLGEAPPGLLYTLDHQCQLILKSDLTRFCGDMLPICRQLYCEDPETGACLPMEAAWAEGSACADSMWCIDGQCVPTDQKPVRLDGNWGLWGPWSGCSRTCGGGVEFSERECNNPVPQHGGEFCHGARIRMRSCAIQPCDKPSNVREELCARIAEQYGSYLDTYIPKLGEASACSLTCLDNGHSVHHGTSLPDGTACYAGRNDICIQGRCWETGCDGILGSSMRHDRCQVCGGDNSTCVEIKGVFNGESVNSIGVHPRGLITALRIPRGVTNAFVRKTSPRTTPFSSDSYDDFMLLIFEELKTQIRRGETREPFAGAELYYSGSRRSEEVVLITGRLQKDVNIVIRVENSKTTRSVPSIEYHYHVDQADQGNPLYFIAEEEARLAAERLNRRDSRSQPPPKINVPIHGSSSNPTDRQPPTETDRRGNQGAQRPQVHFVWRISELPSGCSTCAGNSTSHAECFPIVHSVEERKHFSDMDFYRPVADYLCSANDRPPPVWRRCVDFCGVRWTAVTVTSTSSSDSTTATTTTIKTDKQTPTCSVRCGHGTQAVVHVCEEYVIPARQADHQEAGFWRPSQMGEQACVRAGLGSTPGQNTVVPCQGSCQPVYWVAFNWTECSTNCAVGERRRRFECHEAGGLRWPLKECFNQQQQQATNGPPTNVITKSVAENMLSSFISYSQLSQTIGETVAYEHSERCLSLIGCRHHIQWVTTDWSACELATDSMKNWCRSIGQSASHSAPNVQISARRTRQVTCQFNVPMLDPSLRGYLLNERTQPWAMQAEFCREARLVDANREEPTSQETCDRPICYRWGEAELGECSTTCGSGIRTARIPCERINLDLTASKASSGQQHATPNHWIDKVSLSECHHRLSYSPRVLLDPSNTTIHVETVERPLLARHGYQELKDTQLGHVIQLSCLNRPCRMSIPIWRTTDWSQCSSRCGPGVRRRSILCMLETLDPNQPSEMTATELLTRMQWNATGVVTLNRLNVKQVENQRCENAQLVKPADSEPCDTGSCPQWLPENWSECEGICEYGIQRRRVRCVQQEAEEQTHHTPTSTDERSQAVLFHSSYNRVRTHRSAQLHVIDSARCHEVMTQPATNRLCLLPKGCPFWHRGHWSKCFVDCGIGERLRSVSCRYPNGTTVHSARLNQRWMHDGRTEEPSVPSDSSLETLTRRVEGNSMEPMCLSPRPTDRITCKTRPCTGNQPFWWPVRVSECESHTCEIGRRNRVIKCLNSVRGPIDESSCRHLTRPTDWTPCVPLKCMRFEWAADKWSQCPKRCGLHSRYRRVRCVDMLGEEYSDSLCPSHLKPENWDVCPDLCADASRNCAQVAHRDPNSQDGTFQLLVGLTMTSIYCADMNTTNPKEYIVLRRTNFARAGAHLQPTPTAQWCPPVSSPNALNSFRSYRSLLHTPSLLDTADLSESEHIFQRGVTPVNCPMCVHYSHLASVTYYEKIRVDLTTLIVDIADTRFSHTTGSSPVPFATAKDCFGSQTCPQGQFQIDLEDTSFRVSEQTHWDRSDETAAAHVYRHGKGRRVTGRCGGHCAGCSPRPNLILTISNGKTT